MLTTLIARIVDLSVRYAWAVVERACANFHGRARRFGQEPDLPLSGAGWPRSPGA
jgi:hypothetical protein